MRARLAHKLFDNPIFPYNMSLANYFVRIPKLQTHLEGNVSGFSAIQEAKLEQLVHQLQLSNGAPVTFASAWVTPLSLYHMSLLTLYFLEKVNEYGTFTEITDIIDRVVPHNEYIVEMFSMGMS